MTTTPPPVSPLGRGADRGAGAAKGPGWRFWPWGALVVGALLLVGLLGWYSREVTAAILILGALGAALGLAQSREHSRRLSRQLAAQNRQLQQQAAIMEFSGDLVEGIALDGRVVNWNPAAERIYGYSAGEMIGRPVTVLIPPGREREWPEILERLQQGEPMIRIETERVRKDGQRIHVSLTISPVRDEQGRAVSVSVVGRDITGLKQAEEQLRAALGQAQESESSFRRLLELAPDGIVIVDQRGRIRLVNRETERLFGYSEMELLDQPVEWLMPERFHGRHVDHRAGYQAAPQVRPMGVGLDLFGRHKDGHEFPVEISLGPLKTDGEWLVISIIRDVSQRQHAEEEVRRLNEGLRRQTHQLETANRELEAFSYSVSHDLRAPLRAIDGFSRILLEHHAAGLSEEARRYLQIVRDETKRMGRLIDDLLAFSRLGRQAVRKARIAPAALVQECLDELRAEYQDRPVQIVVDPMPECEADPALLRQVFVNLLSNALKFSRHQAEPRIEVGCCDGNGSGPGGAPVFFVQDNGVGFDMQYADKLFGVFQRLHRVEDYEGTGVGLALARRIVRRHGGDIWAEGQVGQGASFYFTLEGADHG